VSSSASALIATFSGELYKTDSKSSVHSAPLLSNIPILNPSASSPTKASFPPAAAMMYSEAESLTFDLAFRLIYGFWKLSYLLHTLFPSKSTLMFNALHTVLGSVSHFSHISVPAHPSQPSIPAPQAIAYPSTTFASSYVLVIPQHSVLTKSHGPD